MSGEKQDGPNVFKQAGPDGQFRRQPSQFRNFISRDPSADFPAEKDRYVLYITLGCPWAHRTSLVRSLKGLEDIIQLVVGDYEMSSEGWWFSGRRGTAEKDPLYGFTTFKQLYWKADPKYDKRFTVPILWDKKKETVVSNESSEIIRMFYTEFDHLLPEELQEKNKPMLPENLRSEIEEMNGWVYDTINNGVYKTGFAGKQEAYEQHLYPLFDSLQRLDEHCAQPEHQPYLFGEHITEADIRLYTTLIRFDVAYFTMFRCNLKMIRHDYPNLYRWLKTVYWDEGKETNGGAFKKTTAFDHVGLALVASFLTLRSRCNSG